MFELRAATCKEDKSLWTNGSLLWSHGPSFQSCRVLPHHTGHRPELTWNSEQFSQPLHSTVEIPRSNGNSYLSQEWQPSRTKQLEYAPAQVPQSHRQQSAGQSRNSQKRPAINYQGSGVQPASRALLQQRMGKLQVHHIHRGQIQAHPAETVSTQRKRSVLGLTRTENPRKRSISLPFDGPAEIGEGNTGKFAETGRKNRQTLQRYRFF